MLWICLKEDVCLYRPNARWGEFEWPKTLQGSQLENCRKSLGFGGRKTFKKIIKQHLHHLVVWKGFKKKKNQEKKMLSLFHQKTISSIFSYQTQLELQMGLASMVRCNYKMSFLAAITQDGFGEHKDKKYPMCTMKYTAVFLMLWAYISAGGPGHLV